MTEISPSPLNNVITIDDERIKNHLDRVAGGSVDQMIGNTKNGSSMRRPITVQGLYVRAEAHAHTTNQTRATAARRHRTCDRSP